MGSCAPQGTDDKHAEIPAVPRSRRFDIFRARNGYGHESCPLAEPAVRVLQLGFEKQELVLPCLDLLPVHSPFRRVMMHEERAVILLDLFGGRGRRRF